MNALVRIFTYGLFSDHRSVGDWSLDEIYAKLHGKNLDKYTYAEKHALMFFEEMGDYFGERETWTKPYGDVLNEKRKLH